MPLAEPQTSYSINGVAFVEQLHASFFNRFGLSQPFKDDEVLPGDRCGLIRMDSYGPDPEEPDLQSNRAGAEAKRIQVGILIRTAFDATNLSEDEAYRTLDQIFFQEVLDMEQRIALMLQDLCSEYIYEIKSPTQVDNRTYNPLKDKNTWVIDMPTTLTLRFMLYRNFDGTLTPIDS